MKLQIKYFEQSNVNFRQNLNNFIVFIFFFQRDFHIITIETRNLYEAFSFITIGFPET